MKKIVLFIFSFILLSPVFAQRGYEITLKIKGLAPNDTLLLGHHFADTQLIPDDTATVNKKGIAIFKGDNPLPGGMYFIFLPQKNYFDFLLDKDQQFTLSTDIDDLLGSLKLDGNLLNTEFAKYQNFISKENIRARGLVEKRKEASKEEQKKINEELQNINENVQQKLTDLEQQYPDLFLTKFLKATQEISIPKELTDKKDQYYYYRNNYFANFDISDPRLLRTPIYQNKITQYFTKVIPQHPDTLIKEADILIETSRSSEELFRFMMVHIFNTVAKNQIMGMENVYVHLAEKYYIPEASWSDSEFIEDLKVKIERKKNCLLFNNAKELTVRQIPSDTNEISMYYDELEAIQEKGDEFKKNAGNISDQDLIRGYADLHENFMNANGYSYVSSIQNNSAKYTILWFWDPTCSHCKKDTPPFHKKYVEEYKDKGVVVFAVYLQRNLMEWDKYNDHIKKWFDFITKNELYGWINAWDNYNISNFRENYDISSSPVLYLLDSENKIIAKRISYEQAFEIIDEKIKQESEENK